MTCDGDVVVAYPLFRAGGGGSTPTPSLWFEKVSLSTANELLVKAHYLGRSAKAVVCYGAFQGDCLVCCQVWRHPTARMLPQDGTWLELCRWCISRCAISNAGSRMMSWVRRQIRREFASVTTLVSYSDPSHGHSGALYRASGWERRATHHQLRHEANGVGYPSGHGSWDGVRRQSPKHRWCMALR